MSTIKTTLTTMLAGLIVVVAIMILDDNGFSYYDFISFVKSYLKF